MIVFVSYSSKNRKRIEDLVLQLGQLGHDVHFESKVIGGGVTWQQVIDTIATSDLFISTLSAETLVSYTARIEHEYARDLNKYILFVALDDVNTLAGLDPQVAAHAVDFSEANPDANQALAVAISSLTGLESQSATTAPTPNWDAVLGELRQRIKTKSADAGEQSAILLNLREFLERHETYETAKNLLANFMARGDLRPEIKAQSRRLTTQVKRVGSLIQKIQQRGIFYAAIVLSLLVSLAVVLLSQAVLQFRAQRSSTLRLTSTALTLRAVTATFTLVPTRVVPTNASTEIATEMIPTTSVVPSADASTVVPSASVPELTFTGAAASNLAITITEPPKEISSPISLITNTPRPVTGTAVALALDPVNTDTATGTSEPVALISTLPATQAPVATTTPMQSTSSTPTGTPESTATVTLKPISTEVPTQVTQVAVLPTSLAAQMLSSVPTDSMANLEPLITQKLYIGIRVVDSVFGVRVNVLGAAAKSAGIQVGDYILAVDDQIVRTRFEFLKRMQSQNHSANITLKLRRDTKTFDVPLVLSERDFASPYPN